MEITEVRIKLMADTDDRLQAFCSITFDQCFVVRDLKIIGGSSGPFVAMPSRKLTAHCPRCGCKNHLRAGYCNQCGQRLPEERANKDSEGRTKLYADIAHPINSMCRESIQARVIAEFQIELERSKQPGYVSKYDDDYDDDFVEPMEPATRPALASTGSHVEPAASEPRPPHRMMAEPIPNGAPRAESPRDTGAPETGPKAPHFKTPQRESKPRKDFGAGVFD